MAASKTQIVLSLETRLHACVREIEALFLLPAAEFTEAEREARAQLRHLIIQADGKAKELANSAVSKSRRDAQSSLAAGR